MTDLSLAADTNNGVSLSLPRVDLTGYDLEMIVAARGLSYTVTLEDGLSVAVSGSGSSLASVVTWSQTLEQSNALPLGARTKFDLFGSFDGVRSKLAAGTISVDGLGVLTISAASASVPGIQGARGWAPLFAAVTSGSSVALQVADWTGGGGDKPPTGQYLGPDGLVDDIEEATLLASSEDAAAATAAAESAATDAEQVATDAQAIADLLATLEGAANSFDFRFSGNSGYAASAGL